MHHGDPSGLNASSRHGGGTIIGIQYLRAIACVAVVLSHIQVGAGSAKYLSPDRTFDFVRHGTFGVDVFFCISGMIVTKVFFHRKSIGEQQSLPTFLVSRSVRILPMMWCAVVAYSISRWIFRGEALVQPGYTHALLLMPGHIAPEHLWTLRQEFVFYIVFGLAMLTVRKAWLLLIGWGLCSTALLLEGGFRALPWEAGLAQIALGWRTFEFLCGVVLGLFWPHISSKERIYFPSNPLSSLLALFVSIVFLSTFLQIYLPAYCMPLLRVFLMTPMLLYAACCDCSHDRFSRIGSLIGDASYSIYLFHLQITLGGLSILARIDPAMPRWIVLMLLTGLAVGIGVLIHLWLERPFLRYARGRIASIATPRR